MTHRLNRRVFLRLVGGAAVTGAIAGIPRSLLARTIPSRDPILVFHDPGFPDVDGIGLSRDDINRALGGYAVTYAEGGELAGRLGEGGVRTLVTAHGSCFPKEAWDAIEKFLQRGGAWLNLGGRPLMRPVRREGGAWQVEVSQTGYLRRLGITSCVPNEGPLPAGWKILEGEAAGLEGGFDAWETYALTVKLTEGKDFPEEDGSAGPRDAILRSLVHGVDADGTPVVSPFLAIDRLGGRYRGGRWIFALLRGRITTGGIRTLVEYAVAHAGELTVHPSCAVYRTGEKIHVSVSLRPSPAGVRGEGVRVALDVLDEQGGRVGGSTVRLLSRGGSHTGSSVLPGPHLPPGRYALRARATFPGVIEGQGEMRAAGNGFIVSDAPVSGGRPVTHDGMMFYRNGMPFPVTGTTYMAGDVHRKFLLEPNEPLWRRDFAAMKEAGVNLVRTGIWTGWGVMADARGNPREEILRNFEAFLLTAREYDIPVIFTFFAFLPPVWGGKNPYLDPAAVEAQKRFVRGFALRGAGVEDLGWDLINEPSFCSPAHLWECRPNYDEHETRAWGAWLRERYGASSDRERNARLAEAWRCAPGDVAALPALDDFRDSNFFESRHPMKASAYRLFAQEKFNGWIDQMTAVLRENGNPRQMITVGQDEGGAFDRPAPQFHAGRVDFTTIHSWWFNDDLLWDCVVTRPPGTPHLVEETGAMHYERTDGSPWRTGAEVARLMERKMALSFAGGGAGFVQWLWNTNPYMNSDNEAAIGFFRADGSAKPEFHSFRSLALWMRTHGVDLGGREEEDALLVVPQSLLFSARDQATAATRVAVRAMAYGCGMGVRAAGERQLKAVTTVPRLVILPSPGMLARAAWERLQGWVEEGATLVITGSFDGEESGLPTGRMSALGLSPDAEGVAPEESLEIGGATYRVRYRGERNQKILKAAGSDGIRRIALGGGTILWAPLPLELSDDDGPATALYREALAAASLAPAMTVEGGGPGLLVRPVIFAGAVLTVLVNDASRSADVTLTQKSSGFRFRAAVGAGSAAAVLTRRREPAEIARWSPPGL
jgi:hypothetical protein